ncbi:tandem-95 repeat protein [Xinfangfangia sp. D13-10-4-6]|uniref:putative Ig domain-containing protein n=1 Tax=Pseudogemmobacter hezensis TaxID=2737662 RepID=UPI0015547E8D|nr:putative Ig domain-containing protein [Pseudogemmobacter hezensis]NPD16777.1 tandem-95 repeat protein [Pseudogemmobacter hezensis]
MSGALVMLVALTLGLLLSASAAVAQSVTTSASPATFSTEGERISITYSFNPGNYSLSGPVTATSLFGGEPITCGPHNGMNVVQCTSTYTISSMDMMTGTALEMASFQAPRLGGSDLTAQSPQIRMSKVGGGPTVLSLSASPATPKPGDTVTLTATLSSMGCNSGLVPDGTIRIEHAGTTFHAVIQPVMIGNVRTGQGTATVNVMAEAPGTHYINASYAGGMGCAANTSATSYTSRLDPIQLDASMKSGATPGSSVITVRVTNPGSATYTFSPSVNISDANGPLTITSTTNDANSSAVTFAHGTEKRITVNLPAGYAQSSDGRVSGPVGPLQFDITDPLTISGGGPLPDYGQSYSSTFQASGGIAPYTYSATGMPNGLSLNAATGQLQGQVNFVGNYDFTITATDSASQTAIARFAGVILPPMIEITPVSLPAMTVGTATSHALAARGGIAPYTYSVDGNALPSGLSLNPNGTLSGTPTVSGPYAINISVKDNNGYKASKLYSGTIGPLPLSLQSAMPFYARQGQDFVLDMVLTASGGTQPYSFSLVDGPAWLTVTPAGELRGTPPAAGLTGFKLRVTDAANATATNDYSINAVPPKPVVGDTPLTVAANSRHNPVTVTNTGGLITGFSFNQIPAHGHAVITGGAAFYTPEPGFSGTDEFLLTPINDGGLGDIFRVMVTVEKPILKVGPDTLAPVSLGAAVSAQFSADLGTAPYDFVVASGQLPAGVTLSSSGLLSGTATQAGKFTFTVQATDQYNATGQQTLDLDITEPAPIAADDTWTIPANSGATAVPLALTGGTATALTLVAPPENGTANIDGTRITYQPEPGYSGPDSFAYQASNDAGPSGVARISIEVERPTLEVSPPALTTAHVGIAYSQQLSSRHGTAPYTYAVTAGALPAGMSLSSTGVLSGTGMVPDMYSFIVTAVDKYGASGIKHYDLSVTVLAPAASNSTLRLPANSGATPVTLNLSGGVPATLAIAAQATNGTATVNGTTITYQPNPGYSGPDSFTYNATNDGGTSADAVVSVTVDPPQLTLSPAQLNQGQIGAAYSVQISASLGAAPYTYLVTAGTLPDGIQLDSDGRLWGTPTAAGEASFTIEATDAHGATGSQPLVLDILIDAPIAAASTFTLPANSGATPVTLNLSGGVPATLAIAAQATNGTATVNGTTITYLPNPGYSGADSFTYNATNDGGTSADAVVSVTVDPPQLTLSPTQLNQGQIGAAYSVQISASLGAAPYTYQVSAGTLPDGIQLDSDGRLWGTPTAAGEASFTIEATDAHGATGSQPLVLDILIDAPIAAASTFSLPANSGATAVPLNLSGGVPATLAIAAQATNGTATVNGTTITYQPNPGYSGPDSFTYNATNDGGTSANAVVSVTVDPPQLTLSPTQLNQGQVGAAYSVQISASLGAAPYTYQVAAGTLPDGIQLDSDGRLWGTPTAAGEASFTIEATDAHGATGSQPLVLDILIDAPIAAASTLSLPANSGATPVTLNLSGGAVATLAIAAQATNGTAAVNGTTITYLPNPGYSGPDSFTYSATNDGGTSSAALVSVTVEKPLLSLTPASLASGVVGDAYLARFTADGGAGPYRFAQDAGELPDGLSLAADGSLSGTPTEAGTFAFSIIATDAHGATGGLSLSLEILGGTVSALDQQVTIEAGGSTLIDLSQGALGPVTGARILAVEPASAAKAELISRQMGFARSATAGPAAPAPVLLRLTIADSFEGTGHVTFVLTGADGESSPATITFSVARAVDPLESGDAYALASSHNASARRLANRNMDQIHGHMRRMRQNGCLENALNLSLTGPGSDYQSAQSASLSRAVCGDRAVGLWLDGGISFGKWDNSSFAEELSHTTRNLTIGMDFRLSENATGGLALSYGRDVTEIGDLGSKSRNLSYGVTVYATWDLGQDYYVDGLIGLARLDFDTKRWIANEALFANGQREGEQAMFSLAAGRVFTSGTRETDGYLRVSGSRSRLDAFTETGAAGALHYEEQTVRSLVAAIGASTSTSVKLPDGILTSRFSGELNHEFADEGMIAVSYATSGARFERKAAEENRTGLRLGAAFDLERFDGWRLGADLGARFDKDGFSGGDVKLRWLLEF